MNPMLELAGAPRIDLLVAAPVLAPALGAVAVLAVDALVPRRRTPALVLGAAALLTALVTAAVLRLRVTGGDVRSTVCLPEDPVLSGAPGSNVSPCLLRVGETGALLQALAAAAGLAVLVLLLVGVARSARPEDGGAAVGTVPTAASDARTSTDAGPGVEVALLLTTVTGATAVAAAHDLGTWLVGLELATLPIVALAVLRGLSRDSGALHLITTSVTSFAIAVVGAGLWVVAGGSIRLLEPAGWMAAEEPGAEAVLALGATLLVAGVAFKLSLVPFHAWTPATYPRAGAVVTLLLTTVSTIAALGALVAVVSAAIDVTDVLRPVLGVLAVASMLVGAVLALTARDPLRLMAWSAVTQAGGVVAPRAAGDVAAAVGYLAVYVVGSAAVLVVVAALSPSGDRLLTDDRGLLRRRPVHGAVLVLGLLTLAGLPPGVAGLLAKMTAFLPLTAEGLWWVALPAVVAAVLGFAVYLRWVALVLRPVDVRSDDDPSDIGVVEATGRGATGVVAVTGLVLLAATLVPALLLGAGT